MKKYRITDYGEETEFIESINVDVIAVLPSYTPDREKNMTLILDFMNTNIENKVE